MDLIFITKKNDIDMREQVVHACQQLLEWKLVAESTGNVSVLAPDRHAFLITPSAINYRSVGPQDIVIAFLDSDKIIGKRSPSSEIELHRAIYRVRADVSVVIHFHSTFAQAVAIAQKTIPVILDEAANIGVIRTAPYFPSGTQELAEAAASCLGTEDNAVLLANHGAVAVGRSVAETLERAVEVERLAQLFVYANLLGGARPLEKGAVRLAKQFAERYSAAKVRDAHVSCFQSDTEGEAALQTDVEG